MFQEEPFPPEPARSRKGQATAMKSRVNREVQARFCEGLGVKFPGATRPPGTQESATLTLDLHLGDFALVEVELLLRHLGQGSLIVDGGLRG